MLAVGRLGLYYWSEAKKADILFRLTLALSLVADWLLFIGAAAAGSTIIVSTTTDNIATDGYCSLREAIVAANTDSAFNECTAGSGNDTITIDPTLSTPTIFTLTLTGSGEDRAMTGDLDVIGSATNTLTTTGAGLENAIIDGNGTDRVVDIQPGALATISGVTIRNGNPGASNDGGGIALHLTASLTLNNSLVFTNTAASGRGVHVLGGLTLDASIVEANYGGGVHNDGGFLTFKNTQIVSNTNGYGVTDEVLGGLEFDGGTVSGNQGGGILNDNAIATLTNLNIIDNTGGGGEQNKA
ncbi:MAG: CSLREA domain-containing protein [Candidatus Promineifilaceae bacterium]